AGERPVAAVEGGERRVGQTLVHAGAAAERRGQKVEGGGAGRQAGGVDRGNVSHAARRARIGPPTQAPRQRAWPSAGPAVSRSGRQAGLASRQLVSTTNTKVAIPSAARTEPAITPPSYCGLPLSSRARNGTMMRTPAVDRM